MGGGTAWPLAYKNPAGNPDGFFVEVMREASTRAGFQFQWRFEGAMAPALSSGDIDLWAAASRTDERRRLFHLTRPWWLYDHFVVVNDSSSLQGPAELAGKRLSYGNAPPLQTAIQPIFPGAALVRSDDFTNAATLLCKGEVDAALWNAPDLLKMLLNRPPGCDGKPWRIIWQPPLVIELSIASMHPNKDKADRVRDAIDSMILDGKFSRIAAAFPTISSQTTSRMLQLQGEGGQRRLQRWLLLIGLAVASVLVTFGLLWVSWRRKAKQARTALERSLRWKEEFLATMSHEVRTPLNAVFGYMDMLQQTPLRADQRQFAEEVCHASSTLLSLFSDMLDYSSMQNGRIALRPEPVSVPDLIDDATAGVLWQAEEKNLELIVRIDPAVPALLRADPNRLRQILTNLLTNAVKFTDHGFVRLDAAYEDAMLKIAVQDTGIGIPESEQQSVFEAFNRAAMDSGRAREGAGLGLAIVARLTDLMQGSIQLSSAPGVGSRFIVQLPLPAAGGSLGWLSSFNAAAGQTALMLARRSENVAVLAEYLHVAGLTVQRVESFEDLVRRHHDVADGRVPVWGIVMERDYARFSVEPVAAMVRRLSPSNHTPIIVAGTLSSIAAMTETDKQCCEIVLGWPLRARAVKSLLGSKPAPAPSSDPALPVLVVDDNAINRKVATALLERLGCAVEAAKDGREAVDRAAKNHYRLILMDCQMPVMDGYEAARIIRGMNAGTTHCPIHGMSASADELTRSRCVQAGMDGFLPKPPDLEALTRLVAGLKAASAGDASQH